MGKITTKAVVRVKIEIPCNPTWDGSCSLEQVYKEAAQQTMNRVNAMLNKEQGRCIGEPEIVTVTSEMVK